MIIIFIQFLRPNCVNLRAFPLFERFMKSCIQVKLLFPKLEFFSGITFWRVCCDGIEDVDEDEEEGDKECHPTLEFNF